MGAPAIRRDLGAACNSQQVRVIGGSADPPLTALQLPAARRHRRGRVVYSCSGKKMSRNRLGATSHGSLSAIRRVWAVLTIFLNLPVRDCPASMSRGYVMVIADEVDSH
jgi:hypothetical protein